MRISEIFYSLQGEGPYAGQNAIFLRTVGCNLAPKCEWCDTAYAFEGGEEMTAEEVASVVTRLMFKEDCDLVVITGGEPLMWAKELDDVIDALPRGLIEPRVQFETNGKLYKPSRFVNEVDIMYVVSPKLSNATPVMQFDPFWVPLRADTKVIFKFVVGTYDDVEQVNSFVSAYRIPHQLVWLMPECATRLKHFNKWPQIFEWAVENNYNASPRLHVLAFDAKRGV